MKIAYAFRRSTYYPFEAGAAWSLPDERALPDYLGKVRDIGFDGIELGSRQVSIGLVQWRPRNRRRPESMR